MGGIGIELVAMAVSAATDTAGHYLEDYINRPASGDLMQAGQKPL